MAQLIEVVAVAPSPICAKLMTGLVTLFLTFTIMVAEGLIGSLFSLCAVRVSVAVPTATGLMAAMPLPIVPTVKTLPSEETPVTLS